MQRAPSRLAAIALAFGLCMVAPGVQADERTDARREFRAGMQAIADGKYDEGVEHLERAYDILPHPNVLYNIGLAHMYAGRSEAAVEYFERYRETAPATDAVEVESLIQSLQQVKPAETPAVVAEAPSTRPPSATMLSNRETIAALEAAADNVRRLGEEQDSSVLRKQADELQRAVARLRERQLAQATPQTSPAPTTGEPPPKPPIPIAPTPPKFAARAPAQPGTYEEQVVSASRFSQSPLDAPNATAIITAQDIRMSGQTNLTSLLRRIAGVEVTTVAPTHSEVSIRGLNRRSANKILILWDGRPIRKEFLGTNWPDDLPIALEDIERVEIIRGPASALYGADAFSGIINVITRAPGVGRSYASARGGNHGQKAANLSLSGRKGNTAYRAATSVLAANHSVQVVGPRRVDVEPYSNDAPSLGTLYSTTNGELAYTFSPRNVATVGGSFLYGSHVTVQGVSRQTQTDVNGAYEGYAYGSLATSIGLRLGAWYNQTFADTNLSYSTPGGITRASPGLQQRQTEVDLSWTDTLDLGIPQTLTLGTTYRWKHLDWSWLEGERDQHHIGGYLQDVLQLYRSLRLQLGARVDHHPLLTSVQFSPRGSLVYRFLGEQSLRIGGGRAFRGPSFLESYLQLANDTPLRGVSAWGLGNDKLDPESITSFELGYQNQASDYFSLEANAYYNLVKDAILLTNVDRYTLRDFAQGGGLAAYDEINAAFPVSGLSFANERATYRQIGGEVGVRFYPVEGLDLYTNYSIHDAGATDKSKVDQARAAEQQTSLHKVNAGVQYRAHFGLELSADLSWVSSQVWVEQVIDTERGVRWQTYDVDPFAMLSARIGWRLLDQRLELGVVGNNLAFQHQRQHPFGQPLDTRVLGSAKVWF